MHQFPPPAGPSKGSLSTRTHTTHAPTNIPCLFKAFLGCTCRCVWREWWWGRRRKWSRNKEKAAEIKNARPLLLHPAPTPRSPSPLSPSPLSLFLQDACIALRDNELRLQSYKDFTCAAATDGGPRTCAAVQQNAPSGAAVNVGALLDAAATLAASAAASAPPPADGEYAEAPPTLPALFDAGSVCANQDTGYLYVRNGCAEAVRLSVRLATGPYQGRHPCVAVAGRQLSGLALAIVVLGSLAAFAVAGTLLWCCARWCVTRM